MAGCPVCGRDVPGDEFGRIAFHYQRAAEPLRVCVAVGARRDDFGTIAQLQMAHAGVLALERLSVMVAAAAPVLERVAVAIEERTAVAKAGEARASRARASSRRPTSLDDDDGSH